MTCSHHVYFKADKWRNSPWTEAGFSWPPPAAAVSLVLGGLWPPTMSSQPARFSDSEFSFLLLCPSFQILQLLPLAVSSLQSNLVTASRISSSSGCQLPRLLLSIFFHPTCQNVRPSEQPQSSSLAPEFKFTEVLISKSISLLIMPVETWVHSLIGLIFSCYVHELAETP